MRSWRRSAICLVLVVALSATDKLDLMWTLPCSVIAAQHPHLIRVLVCVRGLATSTPASCLAGRPHLRGGLPEHP